MGNREHFIEQAFLELELHPEISVLKESILLETSPLEVLNQPYFLNAIAKIRTSLLPHDLLYTLQGIEQKLGRVHRFDKGPREIDLDILTYGKLKMESDDLSVPHHSLYSRPFIKDILVSMKEGSIYKDLEHAKYSQSV